MKKQTFFVVYDYGQGGVWAALAARSRAQIERRFPELRVFDEPPDWMSETDLKRIETRMSFDIDHPTGWLATLLEQRGDKRPPRPTAAG